jgi:parvulin-like peptidyl-prolyl isomerase
MLSFAAAPFCLAISAARAQQREGPPPPDVQSVAPLPAAGAQEREGPPPPDEKPVSPLPKVDAPYKTVIARVNGKPIFQSEVERILGAVPPDTDPKKLATAQASVLQKLVERQIIIEFLAAQKLVATKDEIDNAIARMRQVLQQQNSTLEESLTRTHQTEASLRNNLGFELAWKKFVERNITDENMQALFDKVHFQLDGSQRRVSHILLRPNEGGEGKIKALVEQAKQLREKIESGELTFEDAAEKYSVGPSHAHGGDLGYIPIEGVMPESFAKTAFALKPGEVSQPVSTMAGIHLIKVTDIKPGTKTWQDVRPQLQQMMSNFLLTQVVKNQLDKATLDYGANVPHFKKGTTELESSEISGLQ